MLDGYVTFDELVELTRLNERLIDTFILKGMPYKRMSRNYTLLTKYNKTILGQKHKSKLFEYSKVCTWIINELL